MKNMIASLFLGGMALIAIAAIACIFSTPYPNEPKHGDRRIVKSYDGFAVEEYKEYPGWYQESKYTSIEQARQNIKQWEDIRKSRTDKEIVE